MGAFRKHLHTMQNQRLMRMREKVTSYNFKVIWTPGKNHHIASTIHHAIAAWRNTSHQDESSPAQLFFGRRQRIGLPLLDQHLEASHLKNADEKNKEATRTHNKADAQATDLPDLRPNDRVWIQHHQTKELYKQATVLES